MPPRQASFALRLLLCALACGACTTLGLRKEPPAPPPAPPGTALTPEPQAPSDDEPLPVTAVSEPIVVAAWAEPKELPAGGGQAQILVRIQKRGGMRFPGVEVRLRSSTGSLFSLGRRAGHGRLGHDPRSADDEEDRHHHAQRRRHALSLPGPGRGARPVSSQPLRPADAATVADLARIVSPERVLTRPIDRLGRSADASIYRLIPEAIVRPRGTGDVQRALRVGQAQEAPPDVPGGGNVALRTGGHRRRPRRARPRLPQGPRPRRRGPDRGRAGRRGRPPQPAAGAAPAAHRTRPRLDRRGHARRHPGQQLLGHVLRRRAEQLPHARQPGRDARRRGHSRHAPARRGRSSSGGPGPRSTRSSWRCATRSAAMGRSRAWCAGSSRPRTRAATACTPFSTSTAPPRSWPTSWSAPRARSASSPR